MKTVTSPRERPRPFPVTEEEGELELAKEDGLDETRGRAEEEEEDKVVASCLARFIGDSPSSLRWMVFGEIAEEAEEDESEDGLFDDEVDMVACMVGLEVAIQSREWKR